MEKQESHNKSYYRLGEVSDMLGLPSTTICYWGKVFADFLKPQRTARGHRRYSPQDIELIERIRRLMHVRKMSVEGAVRHLKATYRISGAVYRPVCRTAEDALRLLRAVSETLEEDGHSIAKLASVMEWIKAL